MIMNAFTVVLNNLNGLSEGATSFVLDWGARGAAVLVIALIAIRALRRPASPTPTLRSIRGS